MPLLLCLYSYASTLTRHTHESSSGPLLLDLTRCLGVFEDTEASSTVPLLQMSCSVAVLELSTALPHLPTPLAHM